MATTKKSSTHKASSSKSKTSSSKAGTKVKRAMHERKEGTLRSGSGTKVTSRKQAIAIGLSEARSAGAKVPRKKSASHSKS